MPALFVYLLKLSVVLSLVYLFYAGVLRRLTFYTWNRWYLTGYSFLAFLLPLVDVSPALRSSGLAQAPVLKQVPSLAPLLVPEETAVQLVNPDTLQVWQVLLLLLCAGSFVMLLRFLVLLASFLRLRAKARLLQGEGIRIYHVEGAVAPFSFGNAVYLNETLHSEAELKEIIRHEFVHVRQRHTLDMLWAELLVLVNWYNPFAWLIRRAVRQNLEFIADEQVLRQGTDRRVYQYLLLKEMGATGFRIAPQFNFSSLKKRIVMINKVRSARMHLLKFLFLLPVTALAVLAFRRQDTPPEPQTPFIQFATIIFDARTQQPLAGVQVKDLNTGTTGRTDEKGYVNLLFPVDTTKKEATFDLQLQKKGYTYRRKDTYVFHSFWAAEKQNRVVALLGMRPGEGSCLDCVSLTDLKYLKAGPVGYAEALETFAAYKREGRTRTLADTVIAPEVRDTTDPKLLLDAFIRRNPGVTGVFWTENNKVVILKGKEQEIFSMDEAGLAAAEKKYGPLPVAPPPPPPPPPHPAKESKGSRKTSGQNGPTGFSGNLPFFLPGSGQPAC